MSGARYGNNLQEAAYSGLTAIVQHLLDTGADINAAGGFYGSALQAAAYGGHQEVVELLLSRKADVDSVGGFYGTALQAAAYGDFPNIVELLLNAGANINAPGGEYGNALRAAAYKGHETIVELLIQKGADVNAQMTDLDALSRESGTALQAAAREGHEAVVQLLIEQGAEIDTIAGFYGTALQAAASEGHEEVVQLLLDSGADINALSGEFGTALQAAACEGHEGVVQLLIENGADVDLEGGEFGSALEAAVEEGHEEIVQILLQHRAEVDSNAVQVALYQGHDAVARILLENGAEISPPDGWLSKSIQAPNEIDGATQPPTGREAATRTTSEGILGYPISSSDQDVERIGVIRERTQVSGSDKVDPTSLDEKRPADGSIVPRSSDPNPARNPPWNIVKNIQKAWRVLRKFAKFVGPGWMIAVAYIDPGNYSTGISAGATYQFRLLFIVLLSNIFAIFLQSLCIKLGTVTGLNLAEHCREHLPKWLNYFLYFLAESAIIATDIAEVIGSAIALNILLKIPLVAGCALTIVDVLVILLFYSPSGSMRRLRYFEYFVLLLVLGIMLCFFLQLSYIEGVRVGEIFEGYLPSGAIVQTNGLYLSCGILGATVMPHSLYLGSGVVQARLHEFDVKEGNVPSRPYNFSSSTLDLKYRPSISAIRNCMSYSIAELVIALFTFALFVNSAILITAGASLNDDDPAQGPDLFDIHALLFKSVAPVAGTIFAVSLLLSGTAAGIVATIAGQMVSEGSLNLTMAPWLRRLLTRSISIMPSMIIAAAVGRDGLTAALNGTQITLSVILPFVSAPLIYFTCRNKYMTVSTSDGGEVKMRNHWFTATLAVLIWLIVVAMNVSLLILILIGKATE